MLKLTQVVLFGSLALGSSVATGVQAANDDHESSRVLTLDVDGLSAMRIDAASGYLRVHGVRDAEEISVEAEIANENEHFELYLVEQDGVAVLFVRTDAGTWNSRFWRRVFFNKARIDLTVKLPDHMSVQINDEDGELSVSDVNGSVEIVDGVGPIEVKNIGGDLTIHDGADHIEVSNVAGDVDIADGTGDMRIVSAGGHITIDDGVGDVWISDSVGGLTVIDDGTGHFSIDNVEGPINLD